MDDDLPLYDWSAAKGGMNRAYQSTETLRPSDGVKCPLDPEMHFHVAETRDFRPSNIDVYSTPSMTVEYSPLAVEGCSRAS